MTSEISPTLQSAQLAKVVGILLLVGGLLCLTFSIVRYNSLLSQALIASGRGDPQLLLTVIFGLLCTFIGIIVTFAGMEILIHHSLPTGLRLFAIYLIIIALLVCFRGGFDALIFWIPIVAIMAGTFILIGALFRNRNIGLLLLSVYAIVVGIVPIMGMAPSILLSILALVAGIFILIGK